MASLIGLRKSIIPACDFTSLVTLNDLVTATAKVPGIGGYKIGLLLGLTWGLREVVSRIRDETDLPITYDHQKGGTDIPSPLGPGFALVLRKAGINAAILFPFGGRITEETWIKALQDQEVHVLVGAEMTQEGFFARDDGFIADDAPLRMFERAISLGVRDFVVPGNKTEAVKGYREYFERMLGEGNFTLYAPGFISQGGDVSETGKVAGKDWHAIVGSALYDQPDSSAMARKAIQLTSQITEA